MGALQASYWRSDGGTQFEVEPARQLGLRAGKPVLRLGVSPLGVEIGGWLEARPFPVGGGSLRYLGTGGVDLIIDERFERHGVRAWAEATWGRSWADADWQDDGLTNFLTARLLAAWRLGGASTGTRYLEPYAAANLLDPDLGVRDDLIAELIAGVNARLWRRARVGVELSRLRAGPNVPPFGAWLPKDQPSPVRAHTTVILQAGAAF